MKMKLRLIAFVLICLVCGLAQAAQEDAHRFLRQLAANSIDVRGIAIAEVYSEGTIADATFITLSKTKGPSSQAKSLASLLKKRKGEARIALFGENSSKTKVVILDALKILKNRQYPGAVIYFGGEEVDFEEIDASAKKCGIEFKGFEFAY